MNIRFDYLYRDAGNYKRFGSTIFSNHQNLEREVLTGQLRNALIEGTFFIADNLRLPDLHFEQFDPSQDHDWHEFESLDYTADLPTDSAPRDILQFIADLAVACEIKAKS